MAKLLKTLNFLVSVLIPLGVLGYFLIEHGYSAPELNNWFTVGTRWVFVFYMFPVTLIYGWTSFNRFYPKDILGGLAMFFPLVIMLGVSIFQGSGLLLDLLLHGSAYYLGLNIVFLAGLAVLVYGRRDDLTWGRGATLVALAAPAMMPMLYFAALVFIRLETQGLIILAVEMLSVAISYFPKFSQLYKEGKL